MKDILIVANFCRDFSINDNSRFLYLCKELAKENHVEIITSDFNHSHKKTKEKLSHTWPFKITFLHEKGYKKNISIKRFISHYGWGKEVNKYLKKRKKPDVIYCAMPSLTAAYYVSKYCKNKNTRFIIDIQDLWPEAFKMVINIPIISDIVFFPFKILADYSYKSADDICAVSNTYEERAKLINSKVTKGHTVFLGTDLKTFDSFCSLKKYIKGSDLWLGYCGSLSASYDLIVVFDALKILKDKGVQIPTFVIMGDGPKKLLFQNYANKLGVDTLFTGRLPYNEMCGVLVQCDIVVNPISKGAAQSIINKHGDYAASGVPVLNTQECKEYQKLVDDYHMGINCKNNDANDLSNRLLYLLTNEKERKNMGKGARKCAIEKFDRKKTYIELLNVIIGE